MAAPRRNEGVAQRSDEEYVLEGIGVSPGIAIGPVYLYARDAYEVEKRRLAEEEVAEELERFERAVARAERDLNKIILVTREKLGEHSADIFEAQLLMLRDEALYGAVRRFIEEKRCNADYAVKVVIDKYRRQLEAGGTEYLRERANDLLDVQERIIRHLRRGKLLSAIDPASIVVAENLTAADVVLFSRRGILGCALDYGGPTSHVSIMARALGVPAVVSMHSVTEHVRTGDLIILDGIRGRVIVNPSGETLEAYRTRQERYQRLLQEDKQLVPLPAETLDGHRVALLANLEFYEELPLLQEYGAEGIGLFRTEILFLVRGSVEISEDTQYEVYRKVVEAVRPGVTTFRVFDLGGDKLLPMAHREHNPFLGWRGIRVLLDRPELLRPQVRAILRAGAHGPVRILLPMVTALSEVRRFRAHLREAADSLRAEGHDLDGEVPVGIMIEVPSVAMQADLFAAEADFFSIGTNDLTQYVLAVDRGNDLVAGLYADLHPAVLMLVDRAVKAGHRQGIPVSLCGELATNPRAIPILVGLGLDELSASPVYLPGIKRIIRAMKRSEGVALARMAMNAASEEAIRENLDHWLDEHACGTAYFLDRAAPSGS
ncbi:phosphoenolpyruvate--protein phosphotransferase [Rhodocaloribacter litoris]|nr:phosphoenolpyruvate--protein phosphotransferase [Rhodocaloribacter litoris]